MANPSQTDPEVIRLAVVMNGGVSLAVWMGGVTHEINRLMNRDVDPQGSSAWAAILAAPSQHDGLERARRIVVDYVAGTSAGGLNGTLLATALARRAPLSGLKTLWIESARLTEQALLLSDASASLGTSLLDGDYFKSQIASTLRDIRPPSDHASDNVTLLVTATALTAPRLRVEDAHEHRFKVSDRRRVYKFESAARAVDGIETFANETLTTAARASASFPAAFEPVLETEDLGDRRVDRWSTSGGVGSSTRSRSKRAKTWLIDGGVLDNAPFEPLLEEMRRNPRPDRGQRWVVYVVPSSPGLPGASTEAEQPPDFPAEAPAWFQVLTRLWGIKGETDLRSDVEALLRLQEEARSNHQSPEVLISGPPLLSSASTVRLLPAYQRTRARGFAQFLRRATASTEKLKVIRLDEALVEELVGLPAPFVPSTLSPTRDGSWQWGTTVARRLALWMSRDLHRRQADSASIEKLADAETQLELLHRRMLGLFVGATDLGQVTPSQALRQREPQVGEVLDALWPVIRQAVEIWAGTYEGLSSTNAWERLLTTEVLLNFAQWRGEASLPEFDVVLVDTGSPDVPVLIAGDRQDLQGKLQSNPDDKLYGTSLGHFGAFGQASYRSHDWTWGRIDGAVCLANALLKGVDGDRGDELKRDLIEEILASERLATGDESNIEALRANTREAYMSTNGSLFVKSINAGEIEVGPLVTALEGAVDRLVSGRLIGPAVDGVTDGIATAVQSVDAVARVARRVEEGLDSLRDRVRNVVRRFWPWRRE